MNGKLFVAIWNFIEKIYSTFVKLRSFFKIMKKIQTRQEIEKIYIDSEKSIKSIEMKKRYLGTKHIFFQFVNNFLALLVCKMNVFFYQIFVISRITEIRLNQTFGWKYACKAFLIIFCHSFDLEIYKIYLNQLTQILKKRFFSLIDQITS